jgi:hypothetical protein
MKDESLFLIFIHVVIPLGLSHSCQHINLAIGVKGYLIKLYNSIVQLIRVDGNREAIIWCALFSFALFFARLFLLFALGPGLGFGPGGRIFSTTDSRIPAADFLTLF